MALIKALKSFSGTVTATAGQEIDVDKEVAQDLVKAGFAEEVKAAKKKAVSKDED